MKIEIKPMTYANVKHAIKIVVEAEVGTRKEVEKDFNKNLTEKTNRYFVAVSDGQIVGAIGWYQDKERCAAKALGKDFPDGGDIYWVAYFAVKSEFRGKGIGKLLVEKIETEVKNKGARQLWVYTSRAKVFYEKCGFKFVKKGYMEKWWQDFLQKDL